MKSQAFSKESFKRLPIIGILRDFSTAEAVEIVSVAMDYGLTTIEVAMNTPDAPQQIEALVEATNGNMNVGAGTVLSVEHLEQALSAGASFIVSPVILPDVIFRCVEGRRPIFPGAFTPNEVQRAWHAGATMVKLFPASHLGPAYIKDIKAPLDDVRILATGGIRLGNVAEYLAAGADGFGLGSPLFDRKRMAAKDWDWMKEQIAGFQKAFAEHRTSNIEH